MKGGTAENSRLCLGKTGTLPKREQVKFNSLVFVQFSKLAEVREVVPDGLKFIPGDVAVTVCVEVLED